MLSQLRPAIVVFALLSLITGILYPLAVTGIARVAFPEQAGGSIVMQDGRAIGSALIGQDFSGSPRYFWGRLSATSPVPYTSFNAETLTASSGSNLGPTNPILVDNARARIEALAAVDAAVGYQRPSGQKVPVDLVTASGSGLDPDISPAAADYQAPRIARARSLTDSQVRDLIARHTSAGQLGVLGEPVVNVFELNLALDAATPPGQ